MSADYRIPKRPVRARVLIRGEPPRDLHLFVGPRAAHHDAGERPSDLLNGGESFLPVRDAKGQMWLLNLEAVLVVTVAAVEESVARALEFQTDDVTCMDVVVALEGGVRVHGTMRYVLPEGQRRLQDHLRQPRRFVALHRGPWVHWINRRRMVWVQCPVTPSTVALAADPASTQSPA